MPYDFPMDIDRRIQAHIASGTFDNEDALLREALDAYERESEDVASIRRGMEDEAEGRVKPVASVIESIQQKFQIPSKS